MVTDETFRDPGLIPAGQAWLSIAVTCLDTLAAPVDVSVSSPAADVDWEVTAELGVTEEAGERTLWHRVPFGESGLPLPSGVEPDGWDDQEAYLDLRVSAAGEVGGSITWSGQRVNGDGSVTSMGRAILTWGEIF